MVRTNQGGSILEFVIVGSVLALLLIGGAYFVRHNLTSADRNGDTVSVNDNGSDDSDDEPDQSPEDEPEDSGDTDENGEDTQPEQDESEERSDDHEEDVVIPGTGGGDQQPPVSHEGETPAQLPETGPADVVLSGILLGGFVAAVAAYKRSRNLPVSL